MSNNTPKVYILILNWNGWKDTIECLNSILKNHYKNYQLLVIDNDSSDQSVEMIKHWADSYDQGKIPYIEYNKITSVNGGRIDEEKMLYEKLPECVDHPLIIINTEGNLGYAGGNNVGINYVLKKDDSNYIWLLNNDTIIESNSLVNLMNSFKYSEKLGMIGSKLLYYHQKVTIQTIAGGFLIPWKGVTKHIGANEVDNGQWDISLEPDYITGASLLVKLAVIKDIGLIPEEYFMYSEEVDWCIRAKQRSWNLNYCFKSIVWHKEGASIGKKSAVQDYYSLRNMLFLIKRYHKKYLILALLFTIYRSITPKLLKLQMLRLHFVIKAYIHFIQGKMGRTI